jgi:hypothetical protein
MKNPGAATPRLRLTLPRLLLRCGAAQLAALQLRGQLLMGLAPRTGLYDQQTNHFMGFNDQLVSHVGYWRTIVNRYWFSHWTVNDSGTI